MLEGKRALVTGSTAGIGLETALVLAKNGCSVALNGFGDTEEIEKIQKSLEQKHGVSVFYHGANMKYPNEINDLIFQTKEVFGGIDILVNNAGIQHVAPIEDFSTDMWNSILAINLSSVFHTSKAVVPMMKEMGWGRIINVSSVHGLVASVNKSAYVAAKHGVVGLTKTIALECAGTGVTCNSISPGFVLTTLIQDQIKARAIELGDSYEDAASNLLAEKQPSGQFVKPSAIAETVAFLCSPAADQITGIAIPIDGGWTAR
eukprot:CAMPEP_0174274994 /NCGR_PEP_ID=MMETSP0439-20130205/59588_1 /TAXON_ID=0 /ORGANISM="Stereomyxa ramosa, Strain Chinc5" /LENGTH=260 /DNA_ID=CAMNT_0015367065 /DNA_START=107 /DNA_END=889 /DNA_ORIENTATION=-